jgi:hypothetical protein
VSEQHPEAPDRPERVRDSLAREVRRRAVDGLEDGRPARVHVPGRREAEAPLQGSAEIGKDIAEKVARDDDVQ